MLRLWVKYAMIVRTGLLVLRVRVLLMTKDLLEVVETLSPGTVGERRDDSTMNDHIYYVDRWLRLFPYNKKGNCFPRALAGYWFARRSGYPVRFHCGVRKEGSRLDGHAWLTLDGEPFHETSRQWREYVVTFSYPSDAPVANGQRQTAHGREARIMPS
ncbi:MAG: conserved protein of unknown function [Nitrospira sp.]